MHATHQNDAHFVAYSIRYYEFLKKKQRKNFLVENREFGSNKANEDTMNTKTNGFDREAKPKMDGRRRV